MPASKQQLYATDLEIGAQVAEREITLDMAAFLNFSALTGDRHPIHYDASYAHDKGFRGPVAHGLLLLALSALGATDLSEQLHDSMVAMTSAQARFLRPVIAGDRLKLTYTVAAVEPRTAGVSLVSFDVELHAIQADSDPGNQPKSTFRLQFLLKDHIDQSHAPEH
ncbi:MaoC family dehydratase [Candidimonas nitroreducens]|uniref:MaoC-like domain-containing protein n=1 Tax=Candidimonas nitroreducens TaxID=683354 RepID=A0A225LZ04_9BURK|nr:MaoC family dehydratase [Candidimonas nitroreducens]OWT54206.1 hypothetical protein CEY11_22840 [Candidimonas nitroreducens]